MKFSWAVIAAMAVSCVSAIAGMTPDEAAKWLKAHPKAQILDVRTDKEFADGHLANAKLIPWTEPEFAKRVKSQLDPEKPVFVYCRSGARSNKAAETLKKLGFKSIHELDGGILAWKKADQPIAPAK